MDAQQAAAHSSVVSAPLRTDNPGMAKQRIYDNELYAHFVTFSCYKRRRLLDHDLARRIVLGVLNSQLSSQAARLIGFVLMPDHIHAIVWFPKTGQLPTFMKLWKQCSSRNIRHKVLPQLSSYQNHIKADDPFWQRKYHAFHIYSASKIEEKLKYMHLNPVRAGLCRKAVDWKWSSARYYEEGKCVGVPITWID